MQVAAAASSVVAVDGTTQRTRKIPGVVGIYATLPAGLLVHVAGERADNLAILSNEDSTPRVIAEAIAGAAVAPGGRRAAVVVRSTPRVLQELELPSGRVLRSVPLAPPLISEGDEVLPIAYSNGAVLLTIRSGDEDHSERAAIWEAGAGGVVADLEGFGATLGGADLDRDGAAPGGLGAFSTRANFEQGVGCAARVAELHTGGDDWELCGSLFAGFSPDGRHLLATTAVRPVQKPALSVYDARTGKQLRSLQLLPLVHSQGWESAESILYATIEGRRLVVGRCIVSTGTCRTVATLPKGLARPAPVAPAEPGPDGAMRVTRRWCRPAALGRRRRDRRAAPSH